MTDLRQTETNSADDSTGRAFGLDGNLYLPILLTGLGALAGFAGLTLGGGLHPATAGSVAALPVITVVGWILGLRQGRPAGYDRDLIEHLLTRGHFTRRAGDQGRLVS